MRSVCGCMSASSAATEIMKTPRVSSIAVSMLCRTRRMAINVRASLASQKTRYARSLAPRSPRLPQQLGAGIRPVHRLGEGVDRRQLLVGEALRDVDLQPVADVRVALATGLGRPLAA